MKLKNEIKEIRNNEYGIDNIFLNRWSPRAMSGEKLPKNELMALFEAAKWAPSASNNQPWRFVYAQRDTEQWEKLFNSLNEGNREWCEKAGALVVILSRSNMEYKNKPNPTASFDTGSAWISLALEGAKRGLVVHGMAGFDYTKAASTVNAGKIFKVEAMCAIGKRAPKNSLPENLQKKEMPSKRKKLSEIAFEGKLPK
ncbi:MAG: nitroreductase [Candidatus Diapherotrites archaeon CG11_big_fil_rev_8_21_14_0_20_37_9]|nr:MAG: nitroreductase [Candidatus Diapherotrites archaeon CG11_big_fil_rev_8_21_14_0_20_37_9]